MEIITTNWQDKLTLILMENDNFVEFIHKPLDGETYSFEMPLDDVLTALEALYKKRERMKEQDARCE